MTDPPLACLVRGCGRPLRRQRAAYICPQGHSYDIARSGYINLLQPQDRRSLTAGDSSAAVGARARLLAAGVGQTLINDMLRCWDARAGGDASVAVDLGSGSGDALAALVSGRALTGIGIDLSTAAAQHAARRFPQLTWVVANADRRLPLLDRRVAVLISLHGRRNPSECARVLERTGLLFVAIPAADDLVELRTIVQGTRVERARVDSLLTEHEPFFSVAARFAVREQRTLDRKSLTDLLQITYRGARASERRHVESLSGMEVTLASECVVFARRT